MADVVVAIEVKAMLIGQGIDPARQAELEQFIKARPEISAPRKRRPRFAPGFFVGGLDCKPVAGGMVRPVTIGANALAMLRQR